MKKQIYRSVIRLEVLSDEPIPEDISLASIADQCDNGDYSGMSAWKVVNTPVKGKQAVKLIEAQGSDPEFFGMDKNGNEIEF